MDGNRRWARDRGLAGIAGHEAGADALRDISRSAAEQGTKWLTVFAFSTENWQRPDTEVKGLLALIARFIKTHFEQLLANNIRLRVVGWRYNFSREL